MDLNANETAKLTNISHVSCKKIFLKLRIYIFHNLLESNISQGESELDESYFGAKRVRGKRGRGDAGKTPVFGLLKRDGNVYVERVENCSREQLMPSMRGKIPEGSTIYTDSKDKPIFAYDGLVLNGCTHHRVYYSKDEFVRGKSHANGIESFWSFTLKLISQV